jgi:hypothetical protein
MLVGGISSGLSILVVMSDDAYRCGQDRPQHLRRLRHRNLVCSPWLSMVSCVIEQAPVPVGAQVDLDNARATLETWKLGPAPAVSRASFRPLPISLPGMKIYMKQEQNHFLAHLEQP